MKKIVKFCALLMVGCMLISGCSSQKQNESNETEVEDENVVINAARPIPDNVSFPEGDSLEDNVWTRLYKEELGVDLKYTWMTPVSQYEQKLNISITSGDIPDIFQVNATQLKQLVDDGQVQDMTEIYEKEASAYTKDVMGQDGGNALLSATYDNKLMAIPKMSSGIGNANVLWIRTDWLDKLGLSEPKNMDDVIEIAKAFTKDDPDGNKADDTFGLALNKDLWGMFASLEGFFNGYGAYPNTWIEKEGGKIENGNIQPEMKEALKSLQDLYKDGCIDPEFGVKDGLKVSEDVNRNKIGMMYGLFWNMGWLTDGKTENPDMEWKPYAIVGKDGQEALAQVAFPITTYYVVSPECKHPEILIKMLNLQLERCFGESAEPDKYNVDADGNSIFEYPLVYSEPPMKNLDAQKAVSKAISEKDDSGLNAEEKGYYDQIMSSQSKTDPNWVLGWSTNKMYGEDGALHVLNEYVEKDRIYNDCYFGPSTLTMTQSQGVLQQNQLQTFTEIIMGGDISKFDKYIDNYKQLGGDEITEEVNAWKKEQ